MKKCNAEVEAAGIGEGLVAPANIPDYTEPEERSRQLIAHYVGNVRKRQSTTRTSSPAGAPAPAGSRLPRMMGAPEPFDGSTLPDPALLGGVFDRAKSVYAGRKCRLRERLPLFGTVFGTFGTAYHIVMFSLAERQNVSL